MKTLIFLMLSLTTAMGFADETGNPDICKVECECWGHFGGDYDPRPSFFIDMVESSGYCPTHISKEELYKYHVAKNQTNCSMLGQSSASRYLRLCKKNFY